MASVGDKVPNVTFKTRVRDETVEGPNPFRWQDVTSDELFKGKRIVLFSLPGAFTPTCSSKQCPGYESLYEDIKGHGGVDEVYCVSVNDAFVMFKWAQDLGVKNIKMLPDGNGHFTDGMGMLVNKEHLGFGKRSWRYSAVVDDGVIKVIFEEPGKNDVGSDSDPYIESTPENILDWVKANPSAVTRELEDA
jgi:peroxiredoxin